MVDAAPSPAACLGPAVRAGLAAICRRASGGDAPVGTYGGPKLLCVPATYRPAVDPRVRPVTQADAAEMIGRLRCVGIPDDPDYLLADDAAVAFVLDGEPVAFAGTHPAGAFANRIGDVMVGTLEGYRRRGCGRAVVSATTGALLQQGRVAVYGTDEENAASVRTALAVGYRELCRVFGVRIGRRE